MREVIIHADDYGLTPSVSEGILAAHAHGVVTSTSILMTHVTPREIAWAHHAPTLDLGLHLNLSSGRPLSPLSEVPSLVGAGQTFALPRVTSDDPHKRFDLSAIPTDEIRRELTAQIEAGLASGLPLSHLDTHHHLHRDPRILELVLTLAAAHGWALRSLDDDHREACARAGVRTTHTFLGDWFGEAEVTREALLAALEALPVATQAELMCHPGYASEELRYASSYVEAREAEQEVLMDATLRPLLRDHGVRLIGWGDLAHPTPIL